jgi:hypothetical protein
MIDNLYNKFSNGDLILELPSLFATESTLVIFCLALKNDSFFSLFDFKDFFYLENLILT